MTQMSMASNIPIKGKSRASRSMFNSKVMIALLMTTSLVMSPIVVADETEDIPTNAIGSGVHDSLVAALSQAGLVSTLSGDGPFTVFAPLDDAFAAISAKTYYGLLREENKDKLVNILGRHVFSKKITSSEIDGEVKLKAINGEEITIKKVNGIVYINEAEVVTADVEVSNGVIHYINRVLKPLK